MEEVTKLIEALKGRWLQTKAVSERDAVLAEGAVTAAQVILDELDKIKDESPKVPAKKAKGAKAPEGTAQ